MCIYLIPNLFFFSRFSDVDEKFEFKQPSSEEDNSVLVTPPVESPTKPEPSSFASTQEAIDSVGKEIESLRASLSPSTSSRHEAVVKMGMEVRELKQEVQYLRESLASSNHHQAILKRRLSYYEKREEDELYRQSLEYDRQKDMLDRERKYSKFAPLNFSRGFVKPRNRR